MSKFNRTKKINPPSVSSRSSRTSRSSASSSQIDTGELDSDIDRNKWQKAYFRHISHASDSEIMPAQSNILTPRIANLTNTVVKYRLQGEFRGMLFSSKKVNSGLGYSIGILIANIIFILVGTMVFVHIEGTAESKERLEDYSTKLHLIEHISNSEKVLPPVDADFQTKIDAIVERLLQLQKEMCKKSNSRAGEKSWEYTGSLHYCLTILSTIGYGVAAPHNNLSKALSVVYAMIGIPIYAVYLSYAYLAISNILDAVCNFIFTACIRRNPGEVIRLLAKLVLANVVLWSYLLILTFLWTPVDKEKKSVVDEIYWQVIRFTSVGFGDEFRDVSEFPEHIRPEANVLIVGFILLPFGISVTSFFFQIYRKLFGNRRKWVGFKCKKIQKKTISRVQTVRLRNRGQDSPNQNYTRSTNISEPNNLIPINETHVS